MSNSKKIALNAMLLALAVLFQNLRVLPFLQVGSPISPFVIGTLVNLVLFISVLIVGLDGSLFIALLTPLIALIQGQIALIVLLPIVMIGNVGLVLVFSLLYHQNKYVGVVVASLVKWIFLWFMTTYGLSVFFDISLPAKAIASFNIPQIVTALLGGFLALFVSKYLKQFIN